MRLKELRKENKLTQVEIAKELNIAQTTYANYELEKNQPPMETLKQLADYYNVTLDYLCEHETKEVIDLSGFSELKKGCVYVLEKLSESNTAIVLGYMTHILQEQSK
jgi:transcriptional regulator with XRE-family HTH domain